MDGSARRVFRDIAADFRERRERIKRKALGPLDYDYRSINIKISTDQRSSSLNLFVIYYPHDTR